jgi:hypothetical protein
MMGRVNLLTLLNWVVNLKEPKILLIFKPINNVESKRQLLKGVDSFLGIVLRHNFEKVLFVSNCKVILEMVVYFHLWLFLLFDFPYPIPHAHIGLNPILYCNISIPILLPFLLLYPIQDAVLLLMKIPYYLYFFALTLKLLLSVMLGLLRLWLLLENCIYFDLSPDKLRILCFFCYLKPSPSSHYSFDKVWVVSTPNVEPYLLLIFLRHSNAVWVGVRYLPYKISIMIHLERKAKFNDLFKQLCSNALLWLRR